MECGVEGLMDDQDAMAKGLYFEAKGRGSEPSSSSSSVPMGSGTDPLWVPWIGLRLARWLERVAA